MIKKVRKFNAGGSSSYEGYVPLNKKGAVIIDEKLATREDRARGAKEAFDRDLEGMRSAYESYKGKSDPASPDISRGMSKADEETIKKVQRAGRESDLTDIRERNRYRAAGKYAEGGLAKAFQTDEEKKRLSAQLTNLNIDKGGAGAAGRVNYKMPLDKQSEIQAYADIEAQKRKGKPMSLSAPMVGLEYTRRFKEGGKVKSASVRADGIAKRGKTKGRMV